MHLFFPLLSSLLRFVAVWRCFWFFPISALSFFSFIGFSCLALSCLVLSCLLFSSSPHSSSLSSRLFLVVSSLLRCLVSSFPLRFSLSILSKFILSFLTSFLFITFFSREIESRQQSVSELLSTEIQCIQKLKSLLGSLPDLERGLCSIFSKKVCELSSILYLRVCSFSPETTQKESIACRSYSLLPTLSAFLFTLVLNTFFPGIMNLKKLVFKNSLSSTRATFFMNYNFCSSWAIMKTTFTVCVKLQVFFVKSRYTIKKHFIHRNPF